jgi:uncharacterized protein YqeY
MNEASLQSDLRDAMRARDQRRIDILRGIIAAAKNLKVEKRVQELDQAELVAIVRKEAKKRNDVIEFATKGGRPEIVADAEAEKEILESYLPSQLSGDELVEVVAQLSQELETIEIGPLMKALRDRYAGRFDGKEASAAIRGLGS